MALEMSTPSSECTGFCWIIPHLDACAILTFFGLGKRLRHRESRRFNALARQRRSGRRVQVGRESREHRRILLDHSLRRRCRTRDFAGPKL